MRLFCWFCRKSISNDVPDDTVVRAVSICPECVPRWINDRPARDPVVARDPDAARAHRQPRQPKD